MKAEVTKHDQLRAPEVGGRGRGRGEGGGRGVGGWMRVVFTSDYLMDGC